ncbi:Os05g0411901 [Oryza sativa Japonica Group]|uniref:Os05g0411901 protein n=1 Tax=Oryza sativa subsp. japonica TaxID=39947 RepID=C7J348_ORYSJ|nr:Os05g0411901 [Oryza sativa Japonica Group]|eukprot:NP_001174421.1 Os05g0411901 [Oryza sativa Japonica Group]
MLLSSSENHHQYPPPPATTSPPNAFSSSSEINAAAAAATHASVSVSVSSPLRRISRLSTGHRYQRYGHADTPILGLVNLYLDQIRQEQEKRRRRRR